MGATPLFLCHFWCCLFQLVALFLLSVPLCFEPYLCLSSSCFAQRAGAFCLSFVSFDPHTLFSMFLSVSRVPEMSKNCPYILPCFSHFPLCVWPTGCRVAFDYVSQLCLLFIVIVFLGVTSYFLNLWWLLCVPFTFKSCPHILPRFSNLQRSVSSTGANAATLCNFQLLCFSWVHFVLFVFCFGTHSLHRFAFFLFSNPSPVVTSAFCRDQRLRRIDLVLDLALQVLIFLVIFLMLISSKSKLVSCLLGAISPSC